MITQIYSIQTVAEAQYCIDAGVDFIGMAAGTEANLPCEISLERGKEIFDYIGTRAGKVALSVALSPDPIYRLIRELQPDIIHVCGNDYMVTPEFCAEAKNIRPGIIVLQAIGIRDESSVAEAVRFSKFVDRLILDSVDPTIAGIGAAGIVNDWSLCRRIVEQAECDIIIAGGLGPHNVADAIRTVRPWGVDSLTKTNTDGNMAKDAEKIKLFVQEAHKAAAELGL